MTGTSLAPGEMGEPQVTSTPSGKVQVRIRIRRLDGELDRVTRTAATKKLALSQARKAATEKLEKRNNDAADELNITADSTINELIVAYLKEQPQREKENKPQSRHNSVRTIQKHIADTPLGSKRIRQVTVGMVKRHHDRLANEGKATSAYQAIIELRKVLDLAMELDVIVGVNPARAYKAKKGKKPKGYVPDALSIEEYRQVIRAYRDRPDRMGPQMQPYLLDVIDIVLGTGARIGEAMGLRWEDVVLDGPVPTVAFGGTVVEGHGLKKVYQEDTKTDAGQRIIPIPQFTVDTLRRRFAESRGRHTFVFETWTGRPVGMHQVRKQAALVRKWSQVTDGVRSITDETTPHAFRRAFATEVAKGETVETTARVLGQTEVGVTDRHYVKKQKLVPDVRKHLGAFAPRPTDGNSTEGLQERVSLALHLAIRDHLASDPERVIHVGTLGALDALKNAKGHSRLLVADWLEMLHKRDVRRIDHIFTAADDYAVEMRSLAVFLGVLSEAERRAVIDRVYEQADIIESL